MGDLVVVTPSYGADYELCRDLNASVLRHTPRSTLHHIFVPQRDLRVFSSLQGPRTLVRSVNDILPRSFVQIPFANLWLNWRRPWPPARGWIVQQIVKLQAAAQAEADLILLADSDVRLVRHIDAKTFEIAGGHRFYRRDALIDSRMPRHLHWHNVARVLLGVGRVAPPLPDYISPFNVWSRATVLGLKNRIEAVTGQPWLEAVASHLHFSEFILYGVFVDEVLGQMKERRVDSMLCHSYWGHLPLGAESGKEFLSAAPRDSVAVMISAKSGTPLDVRRAVLSGL